MVGNRASGANGLPDTRPVTPSGRPACRSRRSRGGGTPTVPSNGTLSQGISGAESVILPDASHMAHVEHPAEYVALLDDFMARVESGI